MTPRSLIVCGCSVMVRAMALSRLAWSGVAVSALRCRALLMVVFSLALSVLMAWIKALSKKYSWGSSSFASVVSGGVCLKYSNMLCASFLICVVSMVEVVRGCMVIAMGVH